VAKIQCCIETSSSNPDTHSSVFYRDVLWEPSGTQRSVVYRRPVWNQVAQSAVLYIDVLWESSGTQRSVLY